MSDRRPAGPKRANILRGVWRLALGRPDGLAQFGHTPQAFLASLAPLIAFPLVLAGLVAAEGGGLSALYRLLATVCLLLAPPVLSHALARFWKREPYWLHFATAFNWCQWAIPVAASLLLLLVDAMMALGLPRETVGLLMPLGLSGVRAVAALVPDAARAAALRPPGSHRRTARERRHRPAVHRPGLIRLLLSGGEGGAR